MIAQLNNDMDYDMLLIEQFNKFNNSLKLVKKTTTTELNLLLNEFKILFNTCTEGCPKIKPHYGDYNKTILLNEYKIYVCEDGKYEVDYCICYVVHFQHLTNCPKTRATLKKICEKIIAKFRRYFNTQKISLSQYYFYKECVDKNDCMN